MKNLLNISIIGLLLSITSIGFAQSTNTYEYDNLNRLTKVTYANGAVVQYTYDNVGNRLTKTVAGVNLQYTIMASTNPSNGGTVSGTGTFNEGDNCTLTATANIGYAFMNWTENGNQVSSEATYSFTVTSNRNLVANFVDESYACNITFNLFDSYGDGWNGNKLVVTSGNGNSDEITLEDGSSGTQTISIADGSRVTLTWVAGNWSNECSFSVCYSNGNVIYYGSNLSSSFMHEFDVDCEGMPETTVDITTTVNLPAGGWVSGAGEYAIGSPCTLIATANTGYMFMYWTLNGQQVSSEATCSFSVTSSMNLVAVFSEVNGSGLLSGTFTVGENTQVRFSKGNLIYQASTGMWRFAENQYDCMGAGNAYVSSNSSSWIDLFCWGTSGWDSGAEEYQPYSTSTNNASYLTGGSSDISLTGDYANADWAFYNSIANGGQQTGKWRCLTHEEYIYLIETRNNASQKYAFANVCGVNGLIILPDEWTLPDGLSFIPQSGTWNDNSYTIEQWALMETAGALFLPATGSRQGTSVFYVGNLGDYWSSTANDESVGHSMSFFNGNVYPGDTRYRCLGTSVRPVQLIQYASYNIQTTANPAVGGMVAGSGQYYDGTSCTVTATANPGYAFVNWTENGIVVSTNSRYTFAVTGDRNLVANFTEISGGYYWSVNVNQYPSNMAVVGIILVNGVEQATTELEIGAFCGDECRGREKLSYVSQMNRYLLFFTLYGNNGDVFRFRLYDHAAGQELDAICSSMITFTTNGTLGTVGNPYEFNFANDVQTQSTELPEGWTWWGTFIEQDGIDGLTQLENSLDNSGIMIKSQSDGFVTRYGDFWMGLLTSINNESSYLVETSENCNMSITGVVAVPSAHPITLPTGWSWIGYPSSAAMSVSMALSNLDPVENDMLKAQEGFSVYYPGIGWFGSLQTVTPGMGLMFESHNVNSVTLTYPSQGRAETLNENITAKDNHWKPDIHEYPCNMSVIAIVELDGEVLQSEDYELAAFASGECRGSAKLMFVEQLHHYMAFLTLYGNEEAELSFGLYDKSRGMAAYESDDRLVFVSNSVVGSPAEPMVVRFRSMSDIDEFGGNMHVFPNPVEPGCVVNIDTMAEENGEVRVEIINALGMVLSTETTTRIPASIKAPKVTGVYMLRITSKEHGTRYMKLIVR